MFYLIATSFKIFKAISKVLLSLSFKGLYSTKSNDLINLCHNPNLLDYFFKDLVEGKGYIKNIQNENTVSLFGQFSKFSSSLTKLGNK